MGKATPHITAAELRIMRVVWRLERATVRQVLEELSAGGAEAPAYTTVMTLMKILAEKGALTVDRSRQPYVYGAAVRKEQVLKHRLSDFLQSFFDGQAAALVRHLAEEADVSPEDLRRIEEKIRQHEQADRKPRRRRGRTRGSE